MRREAHVARGDEGEEQRARGGEAEGLAERSPARHHQDPKVNFWYSYSAVANQPFDASRKLRQLSSTLA